MRYFQFKVQKVSFYLIQFSLYTKTIKGIIEKKACKNLQELLGIPPAIAAEQ